MNMDLGAISARQSAPTDGRDPFGSGGFYTSKQNSDASGLRYQWGRKDPFVFATSSAQWGTTQYEHGKYPVKIYTIDGVLIYQESNGSSNTEKQPGGGIIHSSTFANSMIETIKNPVIFYGVWGGVISTTRQTKDLWDYYWTSHSRGTDGYHTGNSSWHNYYLDGYTSQRPKSIYDSCPFGFRMTPNGTYNNFTINKGWVALSYQSGVLCEIMGSSTWLSSSGTRGYSSGKLENYGVNMYYSTTTISDASSRYVMQIFNSGSLLINRSGYALSYGWPVRCIEDCDP